MEVGVNLFSLRTLLSDEKGVFETFEKLKDMGVSYIQFSGAKYDADMLVKASEILPIVLTHVSYDRIVGDTDALIEEHKRFGCYNIGLGGFVIDALFDKEKCISTIDALEKAAVKCLENGMKLTHHHHSLEFKKLFGDKTVFDMILERAPHLNITIDTYWLQHGGVDVCDYIKKIGHRCECIHLKDYVIAGKTYEELKPAFERVGYGNMDFHSIMKAAKESGIKYFLIEQDDACEKENPLGQIGDSVNYCRREL